MPQLQLVMMSGDYVRRSVSIGNDPVSIGRAPSNEFVVNDDTVSWHHALVWVEGTAAWVKDLASSNGTFLNHEYVEGPVRLRIGDKVRMGEYVELVVRGDQGGWVDWHRSLAVTDVETKVDYIVRADRFTMGTGEACQLKLAVGPELAATLIVHGNGELWLSTDVRLEQVWPDRPFRIAGRALVVRELDPAQFATVAYDPDRYPYEVVATRKGSRARFVDPVSGVAKDLAGSRAALVRALVTGHREVMPHTAVERGWMSLRELATVMWERHDGGTSDIEVLLYRVQQALQGAGLDPLCVELRDGWARLRVAHADIGGISG